MTLANRRRLWVVGFILLVILSAVLFSLRSVIREVIVIPISYIFWVVGVLIDSTAQVFFWLSVLMIGLIVAWRSIRPKRQQREEYYQPITPDPTSGGTSRGRVAYWSTKINMLRLGSYYHENFNQAVSRVLVDLLAYRHHLTSRQVELALKESNLDVPPEVADFVRNNSRDFIETRANIFTWLFNSIREWFILRLKRTPTVTNSLIDPTVRRVLDYMEQELEITYEQSGR